MVQREFGHIKRPCKRCEKMFYPSSKYHRICEECKDKAWEKVRKGYERKRKLRESKLNKLKTYLNPENNN